SDQIQTSPRKTARNTGDDEPSPSSAVSAAPASSPPCVNAATAVRDAAPKPSPQYAPDAAPGDAPWSSWSSPLASTRYPARTRSLAEPAVPQVRKGKCVSSIQ